MDCEKCGGKGFTIKIDNKKAKSIPCECKDVKDYKDKLVEITISEKELEKLIPNFYFRAIEFDGDELRDTIPVPDHLKDIQIDSYVDFMESYLKVIRMGKRPERSYFLEAPTGFGKKTFIYSAIKEAIKGGLTTTGLLDTYEIYGLMEKNKYGDIKELLNKDIVFLTMGGSPTKQDVVVLRMSIDLCERYGIPMIVISRFASNYIGKQDPTMKVDIGVFNTVRGDYGRLKHVGFSPQFRKDYYSYMEVNRSKSDVNKESVSDYKDRLRRGEG